MLAQSSTQNEEAGRGSVLRLKGTFIDVIDQGQRSVHEPRARSEPRRPSHGVWEDEEEQRYLDRLNSTCGYTPAGATSEIGGPWPSRRQFLDRWSYSSNTGPGLLGVGAGAGLGGLFPSSSSTAAPTATTPTAAQIEVGGSTSSASRIPAARAGSAAANWSAHHWKHGEAGDAGRGKGIRGKRQRSTASRDSRRSPRNLSPCSWQGDAGSDRESGGDMESVSSVAHSKTRQEDEEEKLPAFERPQYHDERSAADEVYRWWAGPESEPGGGAWREKRSPAAMRLMQGVVPASQRRGHLPQSSIAKETIPEGTEKKPKESMTSQIVGKWRVCDGSLLGSVWTIEEGGRAFFNGKRFGTEYDIHENCLDNEIGQSNVLLRSDGWTAHLESGPIDSLVWKKEGEETEITWTRVLKPPTSDRQDDGPREPKERKWETKTQLRSKMQASAQQMSDGWKPEDRLSSAMAVIEEIPMRISEDMQRAASYVVDNMQSEVAAMSKQIRGGDWGSVSEDSNEMSRFNAEKVIKNLEVIPTMVQNLLEARVEKARSKVRHRVQGMMENLSAIKEEDWQDHEQLVMQMRMITEEVEQIAGEAVRAAAQECHAHATKQLDSALLALRESGRTDVLQLVASSAASVVTTAASTPDSEKVANEGPLVSVSTTSPSLLENASKPQPRWNESLDPPAGGGAGDHPGSAWKVTHDPEFWDKSVPHSFAKDTMEQAVAVVKDKNHIPQSFTNQVVADELLRARIRSGGGQRRGTGNGSLVQSSLDGGGRPVANPPATPAITNPGSAGHPDLCLRPCLYFTQGNCTNGNECPFCHFPHPKRPVRFDKLHRDTLKKMPFSQFLATMLPVLKQKARDLDFARDFQEVLDQLWPPLEAQVLSGIPDEEPDLSQAAPALTVQDANPWHGPTTPRKSEVSAISSTASGTGSDKSTRRSTFGGALQAMGFRCLLSMLLTKAPEEQTEVRNTIEQVLKNLHSSAVATSSGTSARRHLGSTRSESDYWRFPMKPLESLPEMPPQASGSGNNHSCGSGGEQQAGPSGGVGASAAAAVAAAAAAAVGSHDRAFDHGSGIVADVMSHRRSQQLKKRRNRNDRVFHNWSGPASEALASCSFSARR